MRRLRSIEICAESLEDCGRFDIEEGARDGQRIWCAQALRQSSPQTGNLPSAVQ